MHLAFKLIAGVDVWLNTPTRPLEASGTSGQKAEMNGQDVGAGRLLLAGGRARGAGLVELAGGVHHVRIMREVLQKCVNYLNL